MVYVYYISELKMIKILTIPFSKKDETFFEDEVNQFLLNKKIRTTKAEFFNYKDNFYWTIFVDYDPFTADNKKSEINTGMNE